MAGKFEFSIATNPFQGTITIRSVENLAVDTRFRLFNVNGQLIQAGTVNVGFDTEFASNVLLPGIYFLQIIGKDFDPQVIPVWLSPS